MIRQYHAPHGRAMRLRDSGPWILVGLFHAGAIVYLQFHAGAIVYLQDGLRPFGPGRFWSPIRRSPWIVEGWEPRILHAARRDGRGAWVDTRWSGGHLARVRCLRTGRRAVVADWLLEMSEEFAGEWHPRINRRRIKRRRLARVSRIERRLDKHGLPWGPRS